VIDLCVVIPSYENAEPLRACLAALERARAAHPALGFEVVVVDNGSTDASVDCARASPLGVRLVALARNRGFAAAVNLGLRLRRGRHALLLNSDAELEPDALARGVALLDACSDVGVAGASLRHPDGRPQRSAHGFPGWASELLPDAWLRMLRARAVRGRARGGSPEAAAIEGELAVRDVEAVRGAVFFIRGSALDAVGELDPGYFFFLEETDYCFRVRASGRRVVEAGAIAATHRLGASSKARAPLATRIEYERSLDRFLVLHRGPAAAGLVRALRLLRRLAGLVPGWIVAPVLGARARRRAIERGGLILWHLRGRPAEPSLATALASVLDPALDRVLDPAIERTLEPAGAKAGRPDVGKGTSACTEA